MVWINPYSAANSWGRYSKNVTRYILLVTSKQCNALQLHTTPIKTVMNYILHVTVRAVTILHNTFVR